MNYNFIKTPNDKGKKSSYVHKIIYIFNLNNLQFEPHASKQSITL